MSSDQRPQSQWHRRTFLRAAALGTVIATLVNNQENLLQLGPLEVLANDLSNLPCTAGDVTVDPTAVVVNVPCTCTSSTFAARVAFTVTNHTGTSRYCITLHIPDGFGIPAQDVVLGDIAANTTRVLEGTITGLPCNQTDTLCLGAPDTDGRGKCDPGQCLTIAWNTSPNAPCPDLTPPGGQCRHQRICIQGYGATLRCVTNCTPECGEQATLEACAIAPASRGPFRFALTGSDGSSQTAGPLAGESDGTTCTSFTVTVASATAITYTLTVADKDGCTRTAMTSITPRPLAKPAFSSTTPDCAGKVTLTVTNPVAGVTYTWFDGATQIGTGASLMVTLSPGSHSITVRASRGAACVSTSDPQPIIIAPVLSVSAAVTSGPDCGTGRTTLTATVTGGVAPYTFAWFDGATPIGTTNPLTVNSLSLGAHSITVRVTDSRGCTASSAPVTVTVVSCGDGCTRTLGYWKTHSKYGPARRDKGWDAIKPAGEATPFFDSGQSWYEVLITPPNGNAFYILAHQYIAATLNVLNGANASAISAALATARTLLNTYDTQQGNITGAVRDEFIRLATLLDNYNNGLIGPGHCP